MQRLAVGCADCFEAPSLGGLAAQRHLRVVVLFNYPDPRARYPLMIELHYWHLVLKLGADVHVWRKTQDGLLQCVVARVLSQLYTALMNTDGGGPISQTEATSVIHSKYDKRAAVFLDKADLCELFARVAECYSDVFGPECKPVAPVPAACMSEASPCNTRLLQLVNRPERLLQVPAMAESLLKLGALSIEFSRGETLATFMETDLSYLSSLNSLQLSCNGLQLQRLPETNDGTGTPMLFAALLSLRTLHLTSLHLPCGECFRLSPALETLRFDEVVFVATEKPGQALDLGQCPALVELSLLKCACICSLDISLNSNLSHIVLSGCQQVETLHLPNSAWLHIFDPFPMDNVNTESICTWPQLRRLKLPHSSALSAGAKEGLRRLVQHVDHEKHQLEEVWIQVGDSRRLWEYSVFMWLSGKVTFHFMDVASSLYAPYRTEDFPCAFQAGYTQLKHLCNHHVTQVVGTRLKQCCKPATLEIAHNSDHDIIDLECTCTQPRPFLELLTSMHALTGLTLTTSVEVLSLPESLVALQRLVLEVCFDLSELHIPDQVQLERLEVSRCPSLRSVSYRAGRNTFVNAEYCPALAELRVKSCTDVSALNLYVTCDELCIKLLDTGAELVVTSESHPYFFPISLSGDLLDFI